MDVKNRKNSRLLLGGRSLGVCPEALRRIMQHMVHVAAPHAHDVVESLHRAKEPLDHGERAHLHAVLEGGLAPDVARLRADVDDVDDLETEDRREVD